MLFSVMPEHYLVLVLIWVGTDGNELALACFVPTQEWPPHEM